MPGRADQADWAVTEFAAAELGDARRTQRLISLATSLGDHPRASLPRCLRRPGPPHGRLAPL